MRYMAESIMDKLKQDRKFISEAKDRGCNADVISKMGKDYLEIENYVKETINMISTAVTEVEKNQIEGYCPHAE